MLFLSGLLSFLISVGSISAHSKVIRLATFPIPLMVESDSKGLFIDLTKEIAKRSQLEVHIAVYATSRTLLDFSTDRVDAFFPALEVYMPKKAARSVPFYTKVDFVFSKKGRKLHSLKDLEGKKVGLTFRYPYAKELTTNKKIEFEFAADDVTNMKKLSQGLIDAFVVEERSGLQALLLSGEKNIQYSKKNPLSKQEVFYAFQDNEEGKALADSFSRAIEAMKKDGSFDRLMTPVQ